MFGKEYRVLQLCVSNNEPTELSRTIRSKEIYQGKVWEENGKENWNLQSGADPGGWRGDIQHPLTDSAGRA